MKKQQLPRLMLFSFADRLRLWVLLIEYCVKKPHRSYGYAYVFCLVFNQNKVA